LFLSPDFPAFFGVAALMSGAADFFGFGLGSEIASGGSKPPFDENKNCFLHWQLTQVHANPLPGFRDSGGSRHRM
jgi:hypothetical protein